MNKSILCFLVVLLLPISGRAEQVTCESRKSMKVECDMDTRGEVRLVRQLSSSACVEDQSWGISRSSIWVDKGCRGVFESEGGRSSKAEPSYGSANNNDTGAGDRVVCESIGSARTECDMNTRGEVRVARQLSRTECIEDRNWGLSKHSIWVSGGCRAEFENVSAVNSAGGNRVASNEPTHAQIRACNAVEDRYGEVVSKTALTPGAWEIILKYDDGNYVCNVDGNNKVDYFEKLRR